MKLIDSCGDRRVEEQRRIKITGEVENRLSELHIINEKFDQDIYEWQKQFCTSDDDDLNKLKI